MVKAFMLKPFSIFHLGDCALTIDFGNEISESLNEKVISFAQVIKAADLTGIKDIIPCYSSISIYYDVALIKRKDSSQTAFDLIAGEIRKLAFDQSTYTTTSGELIEIPVCYHPEFAPDLEQLAQERDLSIDELIRLHSEKTYRVYMLGFLPGFPYMGIVDKKLESPRKAEPRTRVPAGSVGIAGLQTGIYPIESPGGWQIIGRSPLKIFQKEKTPPVFLRYGDLVKFYSITRDEFENH